MHVVISELMLWHLKSLVGEKRRLKTNLLADIFNERSTVHLLHRHILLHFGKDYLPAMCVLYFYL